eukprot:4769318-Lingulodinium_polyedra.AAC.1
MDVFVDPSRGWGNSSVCVARSSSIHADGARRNGRLVYQQAVPQRAQTTIGRRANSHCAHIWP